MRALDTYYSLKLVGLISKPFNKWKAYKLGVIDKEGNVLKKPTTTNEKESWTKLHIMARNLRRLISKLPAGKAALNYGAGLFFLKEVKNEFDLSDDFIDNTAKTINEAVVAGDSGGDATNIASGERPNGAVTINVDRKKKKKSTSDK